MAEIEVSRDGAIQTITLNRPKKLNAFTRTLHQELQGALEQGSDLAFKTDRGQLTARHSGTKANHAPNEDGDKSGGRNGGIQR